MVPEHRKKAIESLGAKVEIIGNNSDEADLYAKKISKEQNITLVHPFDDEEVIAGQGTVGLEMLEDFPEVDTVIIPTSGGGLIGGIALAITSVEPVNDIFLTKGFSVNSLPIALADPVIIFITPSGNPASFANTPSARAEYGV